MCVIFGECHDIVAVQISECENQAQNSVQTSEHVQVFCADLMASACEGTCASTVHEGEHHHKTQILLLLLSPNYPSEWKMWIVHMQNWGHNLGWKQIHSKKLTQYTPFLAALCQSFFFSTRIFFIVEQSFCVHFSRITVDFVEARISLSLRGRNVKVTRTYAVIHSWGIIHNKLCLISIFFWLTERGWWNRETSVICFGVIPLEGRDKLWVSQRKDQW